MEPKPDNMDEVLTAIQDQRSHLERDVDEKRAALEEAEAKLSTFRANALSALGAASGSKSAQKQRAERQTVVAKMLEEGLSRAEIVRRTGLVDHLVGYDIDCIRKRRAKQGTKKVFANKPVSVTKTAQHLPSDKTDGPPIVDDDDDDEVEDDLSSDDGLGVDKPALPATSSAPLSSFASDKPGQPGVVRQGCSVGRDQLKSAMKAFKRGERKSSLFITTQDNLHTHVADLDAFGDGETLRDRTGHKHRIAHFELLQGDHTHGLTLQEPSDEFRRGLTG